MTERRTVQVEGDGLSLAVEHFGDGGPPVVLLHGGGQTRHAWDETALALAERGLRAVTYDARGHGHSDWPADQGYQLERFARDLVAVASTLDAPPVVVGASLGGYATMYAVGELRLSVRGLVVVDIAPRVEPEGVQRIFDFMTGHDAGFASVEEAADAVARYLPHRSRPRRTDGLRKNLRLRDDGRYYWHWDPAFIHGVRRHRPSTLLMDNQDIVRRITAPTLLLRGKQSDLLSEDGVAHFLELVPHAEYVDVSDATHMIVGDRNDRFTRAVLDFIDRIDDHRQGETPPGS